MGPRQANGDLLQPRRRPKLDCLMCGGLWPAASAVIGGAVDLHLAVLRTGGRKQRGFAGTRSRPKGQPNERSNLSDLVDAPISCAWVTWVAGKQPFQKGQRRLPNATRTREKKPIRHVQSEVSGKLRPSVETEGSHQGKGKYGVPESPPFERGGYAASDASSAPSSRLLFAFQKPA
ncbi:hypothetical protein VTN77DRAFT_1224 [Rasamsonia byssochlamydoides]|uniref:uncharacterized protein n=1 Tax=Rasamsonia byssochlamydoides TaxID=89139 RepID=UPI0037433ABA